MPTESLVFLTGPVRRAGKYALYEPDSKRAVGFAMASLDLVACESWLVGRGDCVYDDDSMMLANHMHGWPEEFLQEVTDGSNEKLLHKDTLVKSLPYYVRMAHDEMLISIYVASPEGTLRMDFLADSRIVVTSAVHGVLGAALDLARTHQLRCLPSNLGNLLFVYGRELMEANFEEGFIDPGEFSEDDVTIDP